MDLDRLFESAKERERFDTKWKFFQKSYALSLASWQWEFLPGNSKKPIVSTMNNVAFGIRRRLRSILDFETIYRMIFRKMVY